jgi:hypothetical protein
LSHASVDGETKTQVSNLISSVTNSNPHHIKLIEIGIINCHLIVSRFSLYGAATAWRPPVSEEKSP